jgi:uncharacterized damage-inducible protein DinB
MNPNDALRDHLIRLLEWPDAHPSFDDVVSDIPAEHRGTRPAGLPYSCWELVEHLRLCQEDILDFCRDPDYAERTFPDDYWPGTPEPPSPDAWEASLVAFRADREALKRLATDSTLDLFAPIPHGTGQTYLRELLLVADHNAYHVGQIIVVRRLLGIWAD